MQKEVLFQQEETDVSSPESNHQHRPDDAENIPEQKVFFLSPLQPCRAATASLCASFSTSSPIPLFRTTRLLLRCWLNPMLSPKLGGAPPLTISAPSTVRGPPSPLFVVCCSSFVRSPTTKLLSALFSLPLLSPERHGASHKVWSTLNQLSRKAMENTYVAGTVNRLSEGAGLARVIYAQTRELIEEKRREHRTTTTNDPDHSSVTVVIHNNDNFLRGEAEGTSSSEPMPSTAAVHVNPEH